MAIKDKTFAERALLFARLSEIAYQDSSYDMEEDAKALGFPNLELYDRGGAQAYRFLSDTDVVIACRGTQPTEFNDLKADLKAIPVMAETVGKVHLGFKQEVDDIWPKVQKRLGVLRKERDLWFTGHSLGAAMATIMASRCEHDETMPNVIELHTYGSPRVGWGKFVRSLGVTHHRWVNNNDIVTRVPLWSMGYRHDGTEHYINRDGKVAKVTGWARVWDRLLGMIGGIFKGKIDNFSDHSIKQYVSSIGDYANERTL
jgi:triacylglycerol lipase